jgi:hypothetical protein
VPALALPDPVAGVMSPQGRPTRPSHLRETPSIGFDEPALFSEPGLFVIRPDGTLYFGAVQTMPFARPAFGDILKALDFVIANDYPARGEVIDISSA